MRTRTKSIVAALALLSLVSGAIGCKSNGGPWYNPKSYAFHNPFKEGSEAPPYRGEATAQANAKPSLDAQPHINTPPGGYAKADEAEFFAGSQKAVQTQYGQGTEMNRVASTTYPAPEATPGAYSVPESYNPYSTPDPAMANYQQTRYQQAYEQPANNPMPGSHPAPMTTVPAPAESMPVYGNPASNPAAAPYGTTTPAASPYPIQPQPAQGQPVASPYANAPATYGVPAATPYNVDPAAAGAYGNGYTANPSSYQPTTGGF